MPTAARKIAFTDRSLRALKSDGARQTIWDGLQPGMAVRVSAKGQISFAAVRRMPGAAQPSWRKLGDYPTMGLAEAREACRVALKALAAGHDPAKLAISRQREEARKRADMFEVVAEDFASRLESGRILKVRGGGGTLRNAREVAATVRRELIVAETLRGRPITEITRRDVRQTIEGIVARVGEPARAEKTARPGRRSSGGRYAARHAFAAARGLFRWAVRQDLIEMSPCEGLQAVELHGAAAARTRVLNNDELRLVWRAADQAGYPFGSLVKVLLLTGQRRDEIAHMRWSEIDADALLTIPAERMKGGTVHTVPLVATAVDILEGLPRFSGGEYVFSVSSGKRPINGFGRMKKRFNAAVAELAGETVAPWTIHDLRRTVRTGLSSVAVLPVIAELTIGHRQTGISAVYDLYRYDDEKRDALVRWEKKLLAVVSGEPSAPNVVTLKSRAKA